jgi:apolipoprotein N-acyltransferase
MKIFRKIKSFRTPEEKKELRRQLLLALLSGTLLGVSFPPIPLPFLAFVALVPYFYVLEKRDGLAEINRITYFTFFFFNLITLYWVGSWTKDADPFLLIAGTTLMFFNPCLFLIPSSLYYLAKKRFDKNKALLLYPFFFLSYEYLYSITDFRFPWITLGHGQAMFDPFIQVADLIGSYGITVLVLLINVFIYKFLKIRTGKGKQKFVYVSAALVLLLLPLIYGFITYSKISSELPTKRVGLIQPNLNPWKKWEAGNLSEQLDLYLNLSKEAIEEGAEIIIWPESALPVYLLTGAYRSEVNRIHTFTDTNNVYLMTGMPDATFFRDSTKAPKDAKRNSRGTFYTSYNSILFFSPNSKEVGKYGKIKLVPFGEKVPLVESIPVLGDILKWNVGISSWNTGSETVVFSTSDSLKIGGVICIESIYPAFFSEFVQKGSDFLAVVTNDSWYGNSSGPYQHKEFSKLRAVENRRSVVRAANGGISCLIDPLGRSSDESKMFTQDVIVVDVPLNNQQTLFMRFPLFLPLISLTISTILLLIIFYKYLIKRIR